MNSSAPQPVSEGEPAVETVERVSLGSIEEDRVRQYTRGLGQHTGVVVNNNSIPRDTELPMSRVTEVGSDAVQVDLWYNWTDSPHLNDQCRINAGVSRALLRRVEYCRPCSREYKPSLSPARHAAYLQNPR
jgi:hypothetical protein